MVLSQSGSHLPTTLLAEDECAGCVEHRRLGDGPERAHSVSYSQTRSTFQPARCPMPTSREDLFGCDTLVATATGTADRSVIFAKNSDRLPDECQHLRVYPSRDWDKDATVCCQ